MCILAAGIAVAVLREDPGNAGRSGIATNPRTRAAIGETGSLLVAGTSGGERPRLLWTVLLGYDSAGERAAAGYVPAATSAEVPGHGSLTLAAAHLSGGMPLLVLTTENLLGARVDASLEVDREVAPLWLEDIAPLEVDLRDDIRDGQGEIVVEGGRRELDPQALTEVLYTLSREGDQLELGSRHLAVWSSLMGRAQEDESAATSLVDPGSPANLTGEPATTEGLLLSVARTEPTQRRVRALEVTPLEVPGDEVYTVEEADVEGFREQIAGPELARGYETRIQLLNGNGVPGVGRRAAGRLVGEGFRVILSGNAPRLDYGKTLVVAYDRGPGGRRSARRAAELLGVGEVRVSGQDQGIVELTIVIGKDFLRTN